MAGVALPIGKRWGLERIAGHEAEARVVEEDPAHRPELHRVVGGGAVGIARRTRLRREAGSVVGSGVAEGIGPLGEDRSVVGQRAQRVEAARDPGSRLAVVVSHPREVGDASLIEWGHQFLPALQVLHGAVAVLVAGGGDEVRLVVGRLVDHPWEDPEAVVVVPVLLPEVDEGGFVLGHRGPRGLRGRPGRGQSERESAERGRDRGEQTDSGGHRRGGNCIAISLVTWRAAGCRGSGGGRPSHSR